MVRFFGLIIDADEIYKQASSAASLGNAEITVSGVDAEGDLINGNNDNFKLAVPMDAVPSDINAAAKIMYQRFKELVSANLITLPKEEILNKIISIYNRLL